MNADLSHKVAQLMPMLWEVSLPLSEKRRFVDTVAAAESEDALPDWAKEIIRRAGAAREEFCAASVARPDLKRRRRADDEKLTTT